MRCYSAMGDAMDQTTSNQQQAIEDRMYVSPDRFEAGVDVIQDLAKSGALRILVGSGLRPSPFQFELRRDDVALKDVLAGRGLSYSDLTEFIEDLDDCLNALLGGSSPKRFAEVRSDPERWDDGEFESPEVATRKLELVAETFDLADLRKRFWIKRTAKSPIPGRLDWEVLTKNADAGAAAPGPTPVVLATIRLSTEPGSAGPISLTDQLRQVNITVDSEDVGYMIDSLTRLRETMLRTEEEQNG
jgi:hypothetical protein